LQDNNQLSKQMKSMEKILSTEVKSHSVQQEVLYLSRNPNVSQSSQAPVTTPVVNQMNSVHTFPHNPNKISFSKILPSTPVSFK